MSAETDVSFLTISLEALFTTLLIDAKENRDVATFDVTGAFLQLEMPKSDSKVLLKLKDVFVDIMCKVNTKYRSTIVFEN